MKVSIQIRFLNPFRLLKCGYQLCFEIWENEFKFSSAFIFAGTRTDGLIVSRAEQDARQLLLPCKDGKILNGHLISFSIAL